MQRYIDRKSGWDPMIQLWPGVALGLSAGLLTAEPAFAGGAGDTQGKCGKGGTGKPCEIGAWYVFMYIIYIIYRLFGYVIFFWKTNSPHVDVGMMCFSSWCWLQELNSLEGRYIKMMKSWCISSSHSVVDFSSWNSQELSLWAVAHKVARSTLKRHIFQADDGNVDRKPKC